MSILSTVAAMRTMIGKDVRAHARSPTPTLDLPPPRSIFRKASRATWHRLRRVTREQGIPLCACHADPRRQAVSAALTQAVRVSCLASPLGPSAGPGSCKRAACWDDRARSKSERASTSRRCRRHPPHPNCDAVARSFAKRPSAASARATQGPEASANFEKALTAQEGKLADRKTD